MVNPQEEQILNEALDILQRRATSQELEYFKTFCEKMMTYMDERVEIKTMRQEFSSMVRGENEISSFAQQNPEVQIPAPQPIQPPQQQQYQPPQQQYQPPQQQTQVDMPIPGQQPRRGGRLGQLFGK